MKTWLTKKPWLTYERKRSEVNGFKDGKGKKKEHVRDILWSWHLSCTEFDDASGLIDRAERAEESMLEKKADAAVTLLFIGISIADISDPFARQLKVTF